MPTFQISKNKKRFFCQEGLNKPLSDVMEHQISPLIFSKYNNVEYLTSIQVEKPKKQGCGFVRKHLMATRQVHC